MENKNPGRHADASLPATAATQKSRRQPDKLKYEVRRGKYEERKNPEYKIQQKPGGHSLMAPPGPIPNPEVKHQHVDGSRTTGPARVDSCQGKQAPQNESSAGLSVLQRHGTLTTVRSSTYHLLRLIRRRPIGGSPLRGKHIRVCPAALRALGRLVGRQVPRPVFAPLGLRRGLRSLSRATGVDSCQGK